MRIKDGFLTREIAGATVIIPIGERVIDYKGMLIPNSVGSFIWEKLSTETTYEMLVDAIFGEYEVSYEAAKEDLNDFLNEVRSIGALEE